MKPYRGIGGTTPKRAIIVVLVTLGFLAAAVGANLLHKNGAKTLGSIVGYLWPPVLLILVIQDHRRKKRLKLESESQAPG